jgi:hypothetical protein
MKCRFVRLLRRVFDITSVTDRAVDSTGICSICDCSAFTFAV